MSAIQREAIRSQIVLAIKAHVGHGGTISVKDLADATGISERAIKSYQQGPNVPPTDALLQMMLVIGPAFSDRILSIVRQGGVCRLDDNEDATPEALIESAAGVVYEGVKARGRWTHINMRAMAIRAGTLLRRCSGFLARHRRAAA